MATTRTKKEAAPAAIPPRREKTKEGATAAKAAKAAKNGKGDAVTSDNGTATAQAVVTLKNGESIPGGIDPKLLVMDLERNGRAFAPSVQDLFKAIKRDGQDTPILVNPLPDGRYEVVAGYRRALALQELAKTRPNTRVKAVVRIVKDATEALQVNASENHDRANLSALDQAVVIQRLIDHGVDRKEIAQRFSKSNAWITQILKLNTLPTEIQEHVHLGDIPASSAYAMAELPKAEQITLAREYVPGLGYPGGVAPKKEKVTKGKDAKGASSKDADADAQATAEASPAPSRGSAKGQKIRDAVQTKKGKGVKPSLPQIKAYFKEWADQAGGDSDPDWTVLLGERVLAWLAGEKDATDTLDQFFALTNTAMVAGEYVDKDDRWLFEVDPTEQE